MPKKGVSSAPTEGVVAPGQVLDALMADKALGAQLVTPSVSYGAENLYMRGPLEEATRGNLARVRCQPAHTLAVCFTVCAPR